MKKALAILALVAFLGGMSAPVLASNNSTLNLISVTDEDPKKKETKKETKKDAKKSSDCTTAKKSCCDKSAEKKCDTKK